MQLTWYRGEEGDWYADVPGLSEAGYSLSYCIVAIESRDEVGYRLYDPSHEEIGDSFALFREATEAAQTHLDERDL